MRVKLSELRKSYNMTQECISNKLFIHRTHYNHIENGHKGVTFTIIQTKHFDNTYI